MNQTKNCFQMALWIENCLGFNVDVGWIVRRGSTQSLHVLPHTCIGFRVSQMKPKTINRLIKFRKKVKIDPIGGGGGLKPLEFHGCRKREDEVKFGNDMDE
jgi:hypothetical protein